MLDVASLEFAAITMAMCDGVIPEVDKTLWDALTPEQQQPCWQKALDVRAYALDQKRLLAASKAA